MSIGARYHRKENQQKIPGADMLPGILLALSYGKFPIDPKIYLTDDSADSLSIHWNNLASLIDKVAEDLHKEFKPLTVGSTKQYLAAMRKGYKANRNGELPPLDVSLSEVEMMLYIPKRDFESDKILYGQHLPEWMFSQLN